MGFRSTFTTEDYDIAWPEWFVTKYEAGVWFAENRSGTISAKREHKTYDGFGDLHSDIQKAIDWNSFGLESFVLVYLHECGGITRCQIERDAIKWSEPDVWTRTDGVNHSYCYQCSDV